MVFKKTITIAIVAIFCISALAFMNNSEDVKAEVTDTLTYSFYLELADGTNSYSTRLPDATVTGTAASGALYEQALGDACTAGEVTASFGSWNNILSLTASGTTYATSGTYGTAGFKSFAVYIYKDGAWAAANLSDSTQAYAITFGEYFFTEPSDPSKYLKQGDEVNGYYWTLLPTVKVVEYKVYFQFKDSDGSSYSTWVNSTQFGISGESLKSARALGGKAVGITVNNNTKYATSLVSVEANGHTYTTSGTYGTADYIGFSTYTANGNAWASTSAADLDTATVFAHTLDYYKMTDPSDSSYFFHEAAYGMDAYWTKLPAVLPDGSTPSNSGENSLLLYGAIGAVAIIIVIIFAAFVVKRKA